MLKNEELIRLRKQLESLKMEKMKKSNQVGFNRAEIDLRCKAVKKQYAELLVKLKLDEKMEEKKR